MTLRSRSIIWLTVAFCIAIGSGCSKNESSTAPEETQPPEPALTSITVPESLAESENPMARLVVTYVNMVNALTGYSSYFSPPPNSQQLESPVLSSSSTWTYTWTTDSLTITLTVVETDEAYTWDVVLTGTDGIHSYEDWLFIHAEQAKDGTNGIVVMYKPITTDVAMRWEWTVDEDGTCNFVFTFYGDETQGRIEVVAHPDGSGELSFYAYAEGSYDLTFHAEWASEGSGEWWTYQDGEETGHGTWT